MNNPSQFDLTSPFNASWRDWKAILEWEQANTAKTMRQLEEERATAEGLYESLQVMTWHSSYHSPTTACDFCEGVRAALAAYRASHPQPTTSGGK